jgi:hypothetical protein
MKHTSWKAVALATLCSLAPAIVLLPPRNDGDTVNKLLYFSNKKTPEPPQKLPPAKLAATPQPVVQPLTQRVPAPQPAAQPPSVAPAIFQKPPAQVGQTRKPDPTEPALGPKPPESDAIESVVPILGVGTKLSKDQIAVSCADGDIQLVDVIHRTRQLKPELDVVFVLDASSSMYKAMEGIVNSIEIFCDSLTSGGQDIRIAGVQFKTGGVEKSYCPFVPASNLNSFKEWLKNDVLRGVGLHIDLTQGDNAIKRIPESDYRSSAQRIYIVIGDDDNHPGNPGKDLGPSESSTGEPDYVMHTITTQRNNARKIADNTGGYNLALNKEGQIDLSKLRLAEMIIATNLVKIRHRLTPGSHNVNLEPRDGLAFPKQTRSFTVSTN